MQRKREKEKERERGRGGRERAGKGGRKGGREEGKQEGRKGKEALLSMALLLLETVKRSFYPPIPNFLQAGL